MAAYIVRRVLVFFPMLLGITAITFVVANLAPGDPLQAMMNPVEILNVTEAQLERMRELMGLNKPIPVRYLIWLRELATGNFGYSYYTGGAVIDRIAGTLWLTLELTFAALVISTLLGLLFGVIAALRQYSFWDYALTVVSLIGVSIPTFFFALVALLVFALYLPIFPAFGTGYTGEGFSLRSNIYHLILPATVLSLDLMASMTRFSRTAMLEVMRSDYVTTARSKGLSEFLVIGRHAFRNALIPLITIFTLRLPILLGGAVVIEVMFAWPGLGLMAVQSINQEDYPTIMALTLMVSTLVLFSNLLADILYAVVDPRIRVSR